MIFDNLTLAAIALFVLISAFLIGTRNHPQCKNTKGCSDTPSSQDKE
ncbi:MAG: hypothetical protein OQL28_14855 [Sedimenticola sp.]|nr:hypothetical protein [Sedimenticola sp.]